MRIEDIAIAIEIPEIYDGTCVYLMKDGTLVNRFHVAGWGGQGGRRDRVDEWIAKHGDTLRARNADLLDPSPSLADDHPDDDWAAS